MDQLKAKIRNIPDFPKPGILFYDITTLLRDAEGFRQAIDALASPFAGGSIDAVVGMESRGFIFGAAVADRLGAGFIPVRKPGKLPFESISQDYALEYGSNRVEVHTDAVHAGERVAVLDDLLATGGTATAAIMLLERLQAKVVGCAFVIDLVDVGGRARLEQRGHTVHALSTFVESE
jgi:adenine phosphoribosyltransferase